MRIVTQQGIEMIIQLHRRKDRALFLHHPERSARLSASTGPFEDYKFLHTVVQLFYECQFVTERHSHSVCVLEHKRAFIQALSICCDTHIFKSVPKSASQECSATSAPQHSAPSSAHY